MRLYKIIAAVLISLCLSACVSSLLIGNQLQSKLMWTFLKPLVGFDPNEVNFFEAPIIKDRMTAILGDKYEPTMKLLRTAQAADIAGIRCLLVHAKDDAARRWYETWEFEPSPTDPYHLFLILKDLKNLLT